MLRTSLRQWCRKWAASLTAGPGQAKPRRATAPRLEELEPRLAPATFTVDSITDTNVAFAITAGKLDMGGVQTGPNSGDLRWCLSQANRTPGADDIVFNVPDNSTINLNQFLMIYDDVTIDGSTAVNLTLSGQDMYRVLYVNNGTVNIDGLTIAHGLAKGGDGGSGAGGGGGAGMGGGLLINSGTVMLTNVLFGSNQAVGGTGGHLVFGTTGEGGGGGAGGNGGSAITGTGGGGGGFLGNGGASETLSGVLDAGGGGGGGFTGAGGAGSAAAVGVDGSSIGGGGGGVPNQGTPGQGKDGGGNGANFNNGFGGGGGSSGFPGSSSGQNASPNLGGDGGFGGGGGGNGQAGSGGDYGGGGGGGTRGGFGGGGGFLGDGGFGGGGGGGFSIPGSIPSPGLFGGTGDGSANGGGGAGLGGAIFIRAGSLMLLNTTFTNNTASGGAGGGDAATAGQGKGGALFINTGATVQAVGSVPTFSGNSAADAGSTTTNPQDNANVHGTLIPSTVYVDDDWAGTTPGTDPVTDPIGGLVFGFNAFADIQGAVNQVGVNGTVVIFGGNYGAVDFTKVLQPIQLTVNPFFPLQTVVDVGTTTLGADTTFLMSSGADLDFTSTLDGNSTSHALTVNATSAHTLSFDNGVGGILALSALTTNANVTTILNGGQVQTTGAQTYNGDVTLGQAFTILTGIANFNAGLTLGSSETTATSTLQIAGPLNFTSTTTLTTTFTGTAPSQFGHILVGGGNTTTYGNATLALQYSGFTPKVGDHFDVVSNGGFGSGQFVNAPSPGPDLLNGTPYLATYRGTASGGDFILTSTLSVGSRLLPVTPLTVAILPAGLRFQVKLVNALGAPVAGVPVTFTLPGAYGHFNGGLTTITVFTDRHGVATSPLFVPSKLRNIFFRVQAKAASLTVNFRAINVPSWMAGL